MGDALSGGLVEFLPPAGFKDMHPLHLSRGSDVDLQQHPSLPAELSGNFRILRFGSPKRGCIPCDKGRISLQGSAGRIQGISGSFEGFRGKGFSLLGFSFFRRIVRLCPGRNRGIRNRALSELLGLLRRILGTPGNFVFFRKGLLEDLLFRRTPLLRNTSGSLLGNIGWRAKSLSRGLGRGCGGFGRSLSHFAEDRLSPKNRGGSVRRKRGKVHQKEAVKPEGKQKIIYKAHGIIRVPPPEAAPFPLPRHAEGKKYAAPRRRAPGDPPRGRRLSEIPGIRAPEVPAP